MWESELWNTLYSILQVPSLCLMSHTVVKMSIYQLFEGHVCVFAFCVPLTLLTNKITQAADFLPSCAVSEGVLWEYLDVTASLFLGVFFFSYSHTLKIPVIMLGYFCHSESTGNANLVTLVVR